MEASVTKLTASAGMRPPIICDVGTKTADGANVPDEHKIASAVARLASEGMVVHGLVHGIAFSNSDELQGRFVDTTRENFVNTMIISCHSLAEIMHHLAPLMKDGGSAVTLTFDASHRTYPHYNVMGIAKAALEASVRYLAADFGRERIRVNSVSASPEDTLSARGIKHFRAIGAFASAKAPDGKRASLEEIAFEVVNLLDPRSGVNGQNIMVDHGASITEMPPPWNAEMMAGAMTDVAAIYKGDKN
jgi:enoyl-[acyl-carrier protein] reductase I